MAIANLLIAAGASWPAGPYTIGNTGPSSYAVTRQRSLSEVTYYRFTLHPDGTTSTHVRVGETVISSATVGKWLNVASPQIGIGNLYEGNISLANIGDSGQMGINSNAGGFDQYYSLGDERYAQAFCMAQAIGNPIAEATITIRDKARTMTQTFVITVSLNCTI